MEEYKKCPFCGEDIRIEAIKCKHCGEFLEIKREEPPKPKEKKGCQIVIASVCILIILGFFVLAGVAANVNGSGEGILPVVFVFLGVVSIVTGIFFFVKIVNFIKSLRKDISGIEKNTRRR